VSGFGFIPPGRIKKCFEIIPDESIAGESYSNRFEARSL
jgi:hypothetical protein